MYFLDILVTPCLQESMPALAHQISHYRLEWACYDDQHHKCFAHLSARPGVTVSLSMGKVAGTRPGWSGPAISEASASDVQVTSQVADDIPPSSDGPADDDDDRDDTDDQVEEQLVTLMNTFSVWMRIAIYIRLFSHIFLVFLSENWAQTRCRGGQRAQDQESRDWQSDVPACAMTQMTIHTWRLNN